MRTYAKQKCHICGKLISTAGLPWTSHMRKHVRSGLLRERQQLVRRWDQHGNQNIEVSITFEKVPTQS